MIKSIFFRALTLLGLTFVLIGCGAADPADAGGTGTGTPGAAGAAGVSMEDVTKEVEKLIRDSKGKVDTADGQAVATKIVSIIKASQPLGSCSLFNQTIFPGYSEAAADNSKWSYVANGNAYPGGDGKLTVTLDKKGAAGVMTVDTNFMEYKYEKYSIDGIYFLDGALKMQLKTATAAASWALSAFIPSAVSTLTLSEGNLGAGVAKKDIAKMTFKVTFKPEFTATKACGDFVAGLLTQVAQDDVIEVEAIAPGGTFKDSVKMGIKTAGTLALGAPAGSNVPLFLALIGPRNS